MHVINAKTLKPTIAKDTSSVGELIKTKLWNTMSAKPDLSLLI